MRSRAVDAEQLGDAPDEVLLEFVALAVGKDDLPEVLDDADALVLAHLALQHAGEAVEVDRLVLGGGRRPSMSSVEIAARKPEIAR